MTKPVIVTRASKGSALTWTEGDSNLTNLRDATITVSDGTSSTAIDLNGSITFSAGSGISVDEASGTITISNNLDLNGLSDVVITTPSNGHTLVYDTGTSTWVNTAGSSGISQLQDDPSPTLGANLRVNGYSIVSLSNGNIAITPDGSGKTQVKNINYNEGQIYDLGTTSGTITPNVTNGNVQKITLNGNLTFSAFASPEQGQSLTLIVTQDGTGGRTLTSTMKFAGGEKTLSTAANAVDIVSVYHDGTNYWASLAKDFV